MSHRPRRRWFAPWRRVCACGLPGWPCPSLTTGTEHDVDADARAVPQEPTPGTRPTNAVYQPHRPNRPDWTHQASRGFHVNPTDPRGDTPAHGTNMGAFTR